MRALGQVGKGYMPAVIIALLMVANAIYFSMEVSPWSALAGYVCGGFGGFAIALAVLRGRR